MVEKIRRLLMLLLTLTPVVGNAQFFPPGFTDITIDRNGGAPLCDYMFISTIRFILPSPKVPTSIILDRNGDLAWYAYTTENSYDFKPQPGSGYLSLCNNNEFYLLDSTFNITGTVTCVGRPTDFHDLHITPQGRIFAICGTDSVMDLSSLTTSTGFPGSSTGSVSGQTIQELTFGGLLVREWEPWPWYTIQDPDTAFFTQPTSLDFTHTNSIDYDAARDLILLSHRALHEVTFIRWSTGQVLERLGGKNATFAMADSAFFTGQHTAEFLPGSRVSLYDNGAQSDPPLTRGLILAYDTVAGTASVSRSYPASGIVSNSMGSMQVLPDGRVLLNHGRFSPNAGPNIELRDSLGITSASITLEPTYFTYRAFCGDMPFNFARPRIVCTDLGDSLMLGVEQPAPTVYWSTGATAATIVVSDTGRYQAFVPMGIGIAGSEAFEVVDVQAGCPLVSSPGPAPVRPRDPKIVSRTDLLGRPVEGHPRGMIVVERFEDGSSRKRWRP